MTEGKKRVVITLEGNKRKMESAIHELTKFSREARAEPELTATVQTESVESENDVEFSKANE